MLPKKENDSNIFKDSNHQSSKQSDNKAYQFLTVLTLVSFYNWSLSLPRLPVSHIKMLSDPCCRCPIVAEKMSVLGFLTDLSAFYYWCSNCIFPLVSLSPSHVSIYFPSESPAKTLAYGRLKSLLCYLLLLCIFHSTPFRQNRCWKVCCVAVLHSSHFLAFFFIKKRKDWWEHKSCEHLLLCIQATIM